MRKKMESRDLLRLVICSDLRKNLLICLNEDKKSLGDLRNELNISSTTAIHALRELEKSNLAFQDRDKNYALTKIGRILTLKVADFSNAVDVLKKHERFWLEHDLTGIPEHLMEKIGWLNDSVLIKNTETEIFKVHSNFINLLKNAKEIRGVSPFFIPEFAILFEELIFEKNTDIQLILTKEVYEKIDKKAMKNIFANKNLKFKLYLLKGNVSIAFTVADYFLSLGFFHIGGSYDFSNDLVNYNKKAIAWGSELFEHYIELSERVVHV
ncbi:MAG: winged helix-turn-helix domain-containing protein [Candidatus Methanoperedens sp.]|nr:winged helix-turn-helix domain-containing protein [Candidatus Methanoperedens sp.]MCZ7406722.1 winged helix-turn-helix domain-containing protein [Candidatus Methanoperedens sp.]